MSMNSSCTHEDAFMTLTKKISATNLYRYVCTYIHMYVCMHVCIYVYIHTHIYKDNKEDSYNTMSMDCSNHESMLTTS